MCGPLDRVKIGRVGMPEVERLAGKLAVVGTIEIRRQRAYFPGHADDEAARGNVLRDDRARGYETAFADLHAGHDGTAAADHHVVLDRRAARRFHHLDATGLAVV